MEKMSKKIVLIVLLITWLLFRVLTVRTYTFGPMDGYIALHDVAPVTTSTTETYRGHIVHIRNYKLLDIVVMFAYDNFDTQVPKLYIGSYDDYVLRVGRTDVTSKWTVDWQ